MASKRIVTVVGATGVQGGGVVSALLKQGGWDIRALTRNADSAEALKLKAQGVEVISADINKKEDLTKAFSGSYAVFANTVSSYEAGPEPEIELGKLMVDVAMEQNISHYIFSSLENCEAISKGTHKVPHFTSKAIVDEYARSINIPITSIQMSSYYENFNNIMMPRKNADGVYEMGFPVPVDSKFPLASAAELGQVVARVLEEKDKYLGKKILVAAEYLTPTEVASTISTVWKVPVKFNYIPHEVFSKFPFPHASDISEMFDFFAKFGYVGEKLNGRDVFEGKKVVPSLSTLKEWLEKNIPTPPK